MRRFALLVAILVAVPAGIRAQYTRAAADRPQLVVFLTVDQLRPDYLDKWAAQLTGGLGPGQVDLKIGTGIFSRIA